MLSLTSCLWQDDRATTRNVEKVTQLPRSELSVVAGEKVELALQATDGNGSGIDGLRVFFASTSSKLAVDGNGALETMTSTANASLNGGSLPGLAVTTWAAAADAQPGKVAVFAHILADSSEEDVADTALAVRTFTVEIEAAP